jgi:hypothetical protein
VAPGWGVRGGREIYVAKKIVPLIVFALALALAIPAQAITNGVADEGSHPYVGQLFFYVPDEVDPRFTDPGAYYNCSGTLVSPTIVLTAGHCTFGVGLGGESTIQGGDGSGGNDVWVSFSEVPDYEGLPPSADYIPDDNPQRYLDRVEWLEGNTDWHRGRAYPHPEYDDAAFFLHDLGVVVLDQPVVMEEYGALPELRMLNSFVRRAKAHHRFTPVGYGLEKVLPIGVEGGDTRRKANVMLVTLRGTGTAPRGTYAIFSNNIGTVHRGGTCYGDSGGPIFDVRTNVVVAVTSFGVSPNCTGMGGGYRVDQPDDLDWLAGEFGLTP